MIWIGQYIRESMREVYMYEGGVYGLDYWYKSMEYRLEPNLARLA